MIKLFIKSFIIIPLIFSLYSIKANLIYSKKVELPHSTFFLFIQTNDTLGKKEYLKAKDLFLKKKYIKALKIALPLSKNSTNTETVIQINFLIGEIFKTTNNHRNAIRYFKKVLNDILNNKLETSLLNDKENKVNYQKILSENFLNIGSSYQTIPIADSAIYYYEKLLNLHSLNKELEVKKGKVYNNLSGIYFYNKALKDLKKAKYYAYKAIKIHEKTGNNQLLSADYGNLASIYVEQGNFKEAKKLYLKALDFIKDDNRLKAIKYKEVLYDNLGWVMYNLKNHISYNYLDKSIEIRDSLTDINNAILIKELAIKHNNDIKFKEIEAQKEIAQKNTWLLGIASILTTLLLLYFLNVYKLRQQNLKIEFSKKELEQQRKIEKLKLETQTKLLNATIDAKEYERKLIAETLHDNVSTLLSSANLHLQATQKQFKNNTPEEVAKASSIIASAAKHIRDLSHSLVSSILLKFGLAYAIKDVVEKYTNSEISFHTQIKSNNRYDKDFEIRIFNIIQELINNILKHSKADNALIRLKETRGILEFSVEDNGIGFNVEKDKSNEGIGLNQIEARVKMLKGTFTIETSENEGTKIKIKVPVVKK